MSGSILKIDKTSIYSYLDDIEAYNKPKAKILLAIEYKFNLNSTESADIYNNWRTKFLTSKKL